MFSGRDLFCSFFLRRFFVLCGVSLGWNAYLSLMFKEFSLGDSKIGAVALAYEAVEVV